MCAPEAGQLCELRVLLGRRSGSLAAEGIQGCGSPACGRPAATHSAPRPAPTRQRAPRGLPEACSAGLSQPACFSPPSRAFLHLFCTKCADFLLYLEGGRGTAPLSTVPEVDKSPWAGFAASCESGTTPRLKVQTQLQHRCPTYLFKCQNPGERFTQRQGQAGEWGGKPGGGE